MNIPIKCDIQARATSSFTKEQVEARLAELFNLVANNEASPEQVAEVEYLRALMKKKGWE